MKICFSTTVCISPFCSGFWNVKSSFQKHMHLWEFSASTHSSDQRNDVKRNVFLNFEAFNSMISFTEQYRWIFIFVFSPDVLNCVLVTEQKPSRTFILKCPFLISVPFSNSPEHVNALSETRAQRNNLLQN